MPIPPQIASAADKARQLRPLLPATDGEPPVPPPQSPRRRPVQEACTNCRKSKLRCSGERPSCSRCVRRRVECHYHMELGDTTSRVFKKSYQELKNRSAAQDELFGLLRNLPENEAQSLFQRIRSGSDAVAVLNQAKAGNILLQMAVAPETRLRYEFPYLNKMPEDHILDNPYLDSLIYEAASLYSSSPNSPSRLAEKQQSTTVTDGVGSFDSDESKSVYQKPFHAAQVIEPRLTTADISYWTTVCNDNALMRNLLAVFFRCEFNFAAAFQKDYFLEDLAAQRKDFCSSLLVNIILAYSCACYSKFSDRAVYWNPQTLTYRFFVEAKRKWELEATKPRITTIQSGILFSVFYNLCGLDEIGKAHRIHGLALARSMRLFDKNSTEGDSERICRGKAYTAWMLYSWETLVGFSFFHAPLIKNIPPWRLPDPSEDAGWYGEIWVKYPLNHTLSPSFFGHMFKAKCHLRIIMNEFCEATYSEGSQVTLEKANEFRVRLQRWYDDLAEPLLPRTVVLPAQLQLHIYYHHVRLTIFGLLLEVETDQQPSPKQIVSQSRKYLQTIVRLYYLRHGFASMDLFIVIPLMVVGFNCLDAINEQVTASELETLRSTLLLVQRGFTSSVEIISWLRHCIESFGDGCVRRSSPC